MEEIVKILNKLKERINEFRVVKKYDSLNPALKYDINAIEISISLTEIYLYYRDLQNCELDWYKGARFMEDTFSGEWKDIASNYKIISDYVKSGLHKRKN